MKVTIVRTEIGVEGTAAEIREGVPALLTTHAVVQAPAADPAPLAQPVDVITTDHVNDNVVQVAPTPAPPAAAPAHAGTVVELDGIIPRGEPVPGPFESWIDVPHQWRWVNDSMTTMHIMAQPNTRAALCKTSLERIGIRKIGVRDENLVPQMLSVCGGCNAAVKRIRLAEHERDARAAS